jgi:hypothetical protein
MPKNMGLDTELVTIGTGSPPASFPACRQTTADPSALYHCERSSTVERRVDTMMLTLTLAAALLAAPESQAEPPKGTGWVVELRGYTEHRQAKPLGWIIELQGFIKHPKQAEPRKGWIIDWQFPKAKPQPELKMQVQVEAVETFYVDDLPAFFKQLKKR